MHSLELKIPPPLVMLCVAAVMWFAKWRLPVVDISVPSRIAVTIVLVIVGLAVASAAVVALMRAKTTINPMQPNATTTLVLTGIYGYSRNPIYLGDMLILVGWSAYLSNLSSFALITLFPLYITQFQIKPEERRMRANFGSVFADYVRRVRRWV